MRYFGGKTRICKDVAKIIESVREPNQTFLSVFTGGGWVESLIQNKKICCDKHKYLIAMYQALQNGWEPPSQLSNEEYQHIKRYKDENPALTGFVGFGCSFAGKWFGGYAKDSTNRNYCLNAKNSILKKMNGFKNTTFQCIDYRDLSPINSIIYCDPPYKGTTQYDTDEVGKFNHDEFWTIIRKWGEYNTVIISEYDAPNDIECIWKRNVRLDIRDKNNQKKNRIEKLFGLNVDKSKIANNNLISIFA